MQPVDSGDYSVAVIIATYNSGTFLRRIRRNLGAQFEFLDAMGIRSSVWCVDGGSTDTTVENALEFGWRVLRNDAGDPISAKIQAIREVNADFYCFLDHDELLTNPRSLARRVSSMLEHPELVAVFPSGYSTVGLPPAARFGSQFGDVFSALSYSSINDSERRADSLLLRGFKKSEDIDGLVFGSLPVSSSVLLEPVAGGALLRRDSALAVLVEDPSGRSLPNILYTPGRTGLVGHFSDDPVQHVSFDPWDVIARKQDWRVRQAVFGSTSGVQGRHLSSGRKMWVLMRILFGVVAIFPSHIDGFRLSKRSGANVRKGVVFLERSLARSLLSAAFAKISAKVLKMDVRFGRYGE